MTGGFRTMLFAGSALMLAGGLGGCSDPEPETPAIENSAFDEDAAPPAEPNMEAGFDPAPAMTDNLSTAAVVPAEELPPPPPPVAPDQQVLDDASATGMTSRSTRRDPMDDAAPVDEAMSNQRGE